MDDTWFEGAGFGMFIHWDHASQQGLEVSWPLVGGISVLPQGQSVSVEQYHSSAATFDPTEWDPAAVAALAKQAGMTYAVFTARHHSGYSMWPTKQSSFSIASSPYGQDIVGGYVEAMRAAGLRVGLYYSLSDWHHPDYPAFTDADKPYVLGQSPPRGSAEQWDRFLAYLFAQIEELLTAYGPIDILWFDGGWERPDWRAGELRAVIRELMPDCLVNDRLPGFGDYITPEQFVPPQPPPGPWETCMTMNHSWGFNPEDTRYKSTRSLVHTLCETVGRGGNLLLNVSPTGTGALPPEQTSRLAEVGQWVTAHREAVIGTSPGLESWQFYGPTTKRDDRTYLHLLMKPYDTVTVRGMPIRRVTAATLIPGGEALRFSTRCGVIDSLRSDPSGEVVITVPESMVDPIATVIALDLDPAS